MNIRSIYLAGLFAIIGSHIINTNAQQLRNPFDFPILLSGNFGELRSNHFHSGIDFKTQGVEGKPVHTVINVTWSKQIYYSIFSFFLFLYYCTP